MWATCTKKTPNSIPVPWIDWSPGIPMKSDFRIPTTKEHSNPLGQINQPAAYGRSKFEFPLKPPSPIGNTQCWSVVNTSSCHCGLGQWKWMYMEHWCMNDFLFHCPSCSWIVLRMWRSCSFFLFPTYLTCRLYPCFEIIENISMGCHLCLSFSCCCLPPNVICLLGFMSMSISDHLHPQVLWGPSPQ